MTIAINTSSCDVQCCHAAKCCLLPNVASDLRCLCLCCNEYIGTEFRWVQVSINRNKRITSHTCVACVCVAINTLLVSYSASRISFALGCVRIPQEQRGGRRQGFCQDNRIGNMALFCLFHIRGNNVLECGDEKEPSATRRISAH